MNLAYEVITLKCSCGVTIRIPVLNPETRKDTILMCPNCGEKIKEVIG